MNPWETPDPGTHSYGAVWLRLSMDWWRTGPPVLSMEREAEFPTKSARFQHLKRDKSAAAAEFGTLADTESIAPRCLRLA